MNPANTEALAQLRDIHLPGAVSFWPLAPGWWLLLGMLLAIGVAIALYRRARRRSLKRAALRELEGIEQSYRSNGDIGRLALELATLLRRVAVVRFPRRDVASLHGPGWSQFLLRTDAGGGLTEEIVRELSVAIYAGPSAASVASHVDVWSEAARGWIRGNA